MVHLRAVFPAFASSVAPKWPKKFGTIALVFSTHSRTQEAKKIQLFTKNHCNNALVRYNDFTNNEWGRDGQVLH
jgi:hypothetical protein